MSIGTVVGEFFEAAMYHHNNRAVITGMGVLAANGTGLDEFWSTLLKGESGIGPITLFDASDLACRIAGEVKNFNPDDYIDPSLKPKRMGRFTQLGVAAARMAIEDAGVKTAEIRRQGFLPVVMGVSTNAMDLTSVAPRIHTAVAGVPHAAASAIGYHLDVDTRLITLSTGCASSLDAVATASNLIRTGQADIAIAGGTESAIVDYVIESMLKCKRCTTRNEEPERASRPFDKNRDYGLIAEGAGITIVENAEHAAARGVKPYAEIIGYASCADPKDSEEGCGMGNAMSSALSNAGRAINHVDYISAHGPSDIQMDIVETQQIKDVFGLRAYEIPVSSIKGATGCPMGAGGILQIISCCLAIRESIIPPTANYEFPDPNCDLDYVPLVGRRAEISCAMINTHGFGRGNSSMMLNKAD